MTLRPQTAERVVWVDVLKGVAIVLVVLTHSWMVVRASGLASRPWRELDGFLQVARMPLFFGAAGLFAAPWLRRPWHELARRKLLLLAYLYVVWTCVLFAVMVAVPLPFRLPGILDSWTDLLVAPLVPGTTLWFLYALVVFFVIARATARVPAAPLLAVAALVSVVLVDVLQLPRVAWLKVGQYAVVFLATCRLRETVLRTARSSRPGWLLLLVPALLAVSPPFDARTGLDAVPGTSLVAAALALAVGVVICSRLARWRVSEPLAALGRRTLPVYLLHVPLLLLVASTTRDLASSDAASELRLLLPPVLALVVIGGSLLVHRATRRIRALWEVPRSRPAPAAVTAPAAASA